MDRRSSSGMRMHRRRRLLLMLLLLWQAAIGDAAVADAATLSGLEDDPSRGNVVEEGQVVGGPGEVAVERHRRVEQSQLLVAEGIGGVAPEGGHQHGDRGNHRLVHHDQQQPGLEHSKIKAFASYAEPTYRNHNNTSYNRPGN